MRSELMINGFPAKQCIDCRSVYALRTGMFQRRALRSPEYAGGDCAESYQDRCVKCAAARARNTRSNPTARAALARRQERAAWHQANAVRVDAYLSGAASFKKFMDS